jgi:hypothetical protein
MSPPAVRSSLRPARPQSAGVDEGGGGSTPRLVESAEEASAGGRAAAGQSDSGLAEFVHSYLSVHCAKERENAGSESKERENVGGVRVGRVAL